jgi:urea transport system substrate-binding protein
MEAHYIGFNMWVQAVEAAGTTDVRRRARGDVRPAGSEPDRRHREMLPNHHLTKPVLIGEIQGRRPVRHHQPDRAGAGRRLDRLPAGIRGADSDWPGLGCGMYNTETETCVQLQSNY